MSGESGQAIAPLAASSGQWRALRHWLGLQPDWTVTVEAADFIQAVAITRRMRYRDDVMLLYLPADDLIHVRSSSRLGISDMGANRDRVEMLRRQLEHLP